MPYVETETGAAALVGREQAAQHAHERRLAAAVRAEETVNLAVTNLHRDVFDDGAVAEFFRDAAHVNGEVGSSHDHRSGFEAFDFQD